MSNPPDNVFRVLSVAAFGLFLTACSTPPKVDNTPEVTMAVTTAKVRNMGVKGFFASDGKEVLWTTPDMQRRDHVYQSTGQVLGFFGGKGNISQIARLDNNQLWQLDNRQERYQECTLTGCPDRLDFSGAEYDDEDDEADDSEFGDVECAVEFLRNDLQVVKTGEERVINGFQAEEYQVEWIMAIEDDQKRQTRNVITSTVWTTTGADQMAEVEQIQSAYEAAYANATNTTTLAPLYKAFPQEALTILQQYLVDSLSEDMQARIATTAAQGTSIEGLPISTKLQWNARAEACGEAEVAESETEDRLDTSSFKGLLSSVGKQIVDQKVDDAKEAERREIAMAPMFGYVREVESMQVQPVKMSKMQVPEDYKLDDRN